MGLPLWKPKRDTEEEILQDIVKHDEDADEEQDVWERIWPRSAEQQMRTAVQITRLPSSSSSSSSNTRQHSVNNHTSDRLLSPVSSTSPITTSTNSPPNTLRRFRIARRHSMLTSSLMDRRRSSRVHQLPVTTSANASLPMRSELDRRLQQRITEKEDLLEQLQTTVSLLDRFLSARTALGQDNTLPAFFTEDLPAVLESAASLAATAPFVLSSSVPPPTNNNSEVSTLHEMVDRLLQIPPYSIRMNNVENNIISAHLRIRQQLSLLSSQPNTPIPPIIRPDTTIITTTPSSSIAFTNNINNINQQPLENSNATTRPSFLNFLSP